MNNIIIHKNERRTSRLSLAAFGIPALCILGEAWRHGVKRGAGSMKHDEADPANSFPFSLFFSLFHPIMSTESCSNVTNTKKCHKIQRAMMMLMLMLILIIMIVIMMMMYI